MALTETVKEAVGLGGTSEGLSLDLRLNYGFIDLRS